MQSIVKNEDSRSPKRRIIFVIADPINKKQIEALLFAENEEMEYIKKGRMLVLKNIKLAPLEDGLWTLKSTYNTQLIYKFENDQLVKLSQFIDCDFEGMEFESYSKIRYYRRTFKQLFEALELCGPEKKLFSKVNCYFLCPFGEKKYYYEACSKCNKKVTQVNRFSYHCDKCSKIVEIKQQYLLKAVLADATGHVKVTFVGDFGKRILKLDAYDFCLMKENDRNRHMQKCRFQEFSVHLKSTRIDNVLSHNVQMIEEPEMNNMQKLRRLMEEQQDYQRFLAEHKSMVKKQYKA